MITRVVKMAFREDKQREFEEIFNSTQAGIRQFAGCLSVELHKDVSNPTVYFTISIWQSADALEGYRSSDFFKTTWAMVKPMFAERAQAWTLDPVNKG